MDEGVAFGVRVGGDGVPIAPVCLEVRGELSVVLEADVDEVNGGIHHSLAELFREAEVALSTPLPALIIPFRIKGS